MSDALDAGLAGIAPDPTDATAALDPTSATRMLGDATAATRAETRRPAERTRRPLEPLDEPPRRRAARPRRGRRRRRSASAGARPRSATRSARLIALVLLLGVIVLGVLGYQLVQDSTDRAVQLREDVRGNVQDAVDEIKGLIDDNTQ